MEELRCSPGGYAILKLNAVFPRGLNRLHDAIENLNSSEIFTGKDEKNKVVLMRSELKDGTDWGYVIELRIPYFTQGRDEHQAKMVPSTVLLDLMQVLGIFMPANWSELRKTPAVRRGFSFLNFLTPL